MSIDEDIRKDLQKLTIDDTKCTIDDTGWQLKIFGALLEDPSTCDVTFKTSDGGSVSAHRVIVAAGSPVFHAMLYGNMKESSQKEIELPNIGGEILQYLLAFMYMGKVCFNVNKCLCVLEAANYFGIEALESCCVDYIGTTLSVDNCCQTATYAHSKNFQLLTDKCLSYMFTQAVELIKTSQFKELPTDVLSTFLQSSDVHASEIDLFLATVGWYKNQVEKSSDTADADKSIFQLIRYPLISKYDLIDKVRPIKETDSTLYTTALEYHLVPEKYSGSAEQVKQRKPCFEIISVTPDTVVLEKWKNKTIISRIGTTGWKGLCAIKVNPLPDIPETCVVTDKCVEEKEYAKGSKDVKFKLCLKSCYDHSLLSLS